LFQGDIGTRNLLLDGDDNIKFCDFAGSSIDGENSWVCPSIHPMYPFFTDRATAMPTVRSELFALGSVLYEISTTIRPHDGKEFYEVEALYIASEFPAGTRSLLLGDVIWKCWASQYAVSGEVVGLGDRSSFPNQHHHHLIMN
jgi:serine/threonine protein kinase